MKYLAFDIEIARDFDRISIQEFKPDPGEFVKIPGKEGWIDAIHEENGKFIPKFLTKQQVAFFEQPQYWQPIDNKDWKRFRPLGITCAAAVSSDGELWNWYAHQDGRFTDRMGGYDAECMVRILMKLARECTLLTWNGLGFDFDMLAEESGMHQECKELALNHIDMMFHFHCSKGYSLGLDAAAKGMKLPGKPEGMTGAKAPELWAKREYHKVLDYVSWDVKNTLSTAQAVEAAGRLNWTARSGNPNSWPCKKWMTVKEAMALPEPDTSWMDDPWPRSKFYGWAGYKPPILPSPIDTSHLDPEEWTLASYDD